MNNIFKNVMNAAANSTSTFVEKMYKSEKKILQRKLTATLLKQLLPFWTKRATRLW